MLSLIIVKDHFEIQVEKINSPITKIGSGPESDILLKDLNGKGLILTIDDGRAILSEVSKGDYKTKSGPWGKAIKQDSVYFLESYRLFLTFASVLKESPSGNFNINLDKLPKDPTKRSYASDLLGFFIESIGVDEAAMFLYQRDSFKVLATKKLSIRNRGELFLKEYFTKIEGNSVRRVSFDTHTLLFKVGLKPKNFLIAKSNLNKDDAVFLYIPENRTQSNSQKETLNVLLYLTTQAISLHILAQERKNLDPSIDGGMFWGRSLNMQRVKQLTDKVASTDLSVLIEGETGVGKEKIVDYISQKSLSTHIVPVNCAAIPQNLVESILFGHVKGAFTGADKNQIGKIQEAHNGILFLDEIAELSLEIQAKLLRVLQNFQVTPIGGKETSVNFRLVAASYQNLEKLVSDGFFREDLYFRINEVLIKIPPLRERSQDLFSLAELFLLDYCKKNNIEEKYISEDLSNYIRNYSWPGNIRELKSFIRKCAVFSDDKLITLKTIEGFHQASNLKNKEEIFDLATAKKNFLAKHINRALQHCEGNKTKTAKLLNVSARSFFRILSELKDDGFNLGYDSSDIVNSPRSLKLKQTKVAQNWQAN